MRLIERRPSLRRNEPSPKGRIVRFTSVQKQITRRLRASSRNAILFHCGFNEIFVKLSHLGSLHRKLISTIALFRGKNVNAFLLSSGRPPLTGGAQDVLRKQANRRRGTMRLRIDRGVSRPRSLLRSDHLQTYLGSGMRVRPLLQ